MKMNQKYVWMAFVLSGGLVGCQSGNRTTMKTEPVKVKVWTVEATPTINTLGFSGTVEEMTGATLSFPTGGTVDKIAVNVGQRVAKGTLIATVDEATLQNTYNATSALRTQAEDAYQRLKQLYENGSLPEVQWVEAQSKLKQAVASEQVAKKSLEDCRLYAPFSGVISEKNVETGQNVMPGMPVVKLVTIGQVKVKIAVPENEIARIQTGQKIYFSVSALDNREFEGTVSEKGVVANALSRSYEVKAVVDNTGQMLMPGMICQVNLTQGVEREKAIVLPPRVVQLDEENHSFVWVTAHGKAEKRAVQVGKLTDRGIIITKGLAIGEDVIVEGQQKVSSQTQVTTDNR